MPSPYLFPRPRSARFGRSAVDHTRSRWVIVDPSYSDTLKRHAAALCFEVGDLLAQQPEVHCGKPSAGDALLRIARPKRSVGAQGYELTSTPDGITLTAGDEAGAYYGLLTLGQVLNATAPHVPTFTIKDAPDLPARGVMLDVSRCKVPTMATLRQIVDLMTGAKLNQLQLYTEHTFAYAAHETVWHDASPMTAAEIVELDAYCRERYVELVPNQNSFGHFERWLRHPEYHHLAERVPGGVLRPNKASSTFLRGLFDELLPNFTSDLFNVGCDETWDLGTGWSKARCDKVGTTRVYLDFLLEIHKQVSKHHRQMMFWGDIILHQPDLVKELPKDIIALEWGYGAKHDFNGRCAHFARAGVPFYVCPGTSSWNSLGGRTDNALANLASAARNAHKHGAIGYLNTDWGDGGHHQYLPISYLGYLAGAAYSWCYNANRGQDIVAAINAFAVNDPTDATGRVLYDLGNVPQAVGDGFGNSNLFNNMLFANDDRLKKLAKGVTRPGLRRAMKELDRLDAELASAQPMSPDGELVKAEVTNAIAMVRLGAQRGLAAKGGDVDAGQLRRDLQHAIGRHSDLWLARNRVGGLNESSGRLRKALATMD